MKAFVAAFAALAVAGAASAQTVSMTPELKQVIEGAKKEGKVVISMAAQPLNGAAGAKFAEENLNKMFGTDIEVAWSAGPFYAAVAGKMLAESQAKQPSSSDVFLGTAVQVAPFHKQGLWRKVEWQKLMPSRITPAMVEADGTSVRVSTAYPAVIYNKRAAPQTANLASLEDFLKPEWKGKFYSTPILAGFDIVVAEENWGLKKTEDYIGKFAKQAAGVIDCGSSDRVASGEIPVLAIDCGGVDAFHPKYKETNGIKILKDFAQKRYSYLAIPQNSPHPNAAALYILFWLTEMGQDYLWNALGTEQSDFPGSRRAAEIKALEDQGYKFTVVTVDWWEKQKDITQAHRRIMQVMRREGAR